jgi:hypothetical protein
MSTFYYPSGDCGGVSVVPAHTGTSCPDKEKGKIRHAFIYKSTFSFVSPENQNEWTNGLNAGDIQILWGVNGSYDGGTVTEDVGFGDQEFTNGGRTHIVNIKDPNYYDNCDFYNALSQTQEFKFGYVTENYTHFTDVVCKFLAKNPVQEDIKSIVLWELEVKWSGDNSPCPYNKPANVFDRPFQVAA